MSRPKTRKKRSSCHQALAIRRENIMRGKENSAGIDPEGSSILDAPGTVLPGDKLFHLCFRKENYR
jgi:hypothetical protein